MIYFKKSYKRACSILKELPQIVDISNLGEIKGLGDSLLIKIQEIMKSGTLKLLNTYTNDPRISALMSFRKIWGVGPAAAEELYRRGCRTIDDVRNHAQDVLTMQQKIGLAHYDDFNERMPASEAASIEQM